MSNTLNALCCVCGNLRTCRRPRNYQRENRWLNGPVDPSWHRETGDLKCDVCGNITVHAIITGDNHAEEIRKAATGWHYKELDADGRHRVQERWRQGRLENPFLRHQWWTSDERAAREAGKTRFQAICMAEIPVPARTPEDRDRSYAHNELAAPSEFHDVDREDPETGLWWFDVDCVDCLYRSNAIALEYQRKELQKRLSEIVDKVSSLDATTVAVLLHHFQTGSEVSEQ